jgi:hypothetical protein
MTTEEKHILNVHKNTNSAVNNMKEAKRNKHPDPFQDYKVKVFHNTNEFNEYFIQAWNFKDLIVRLSNIVEPSINIFKCKIEIERI